MIADGCTFRFTPEPIRLGEFDLGGVLYHSNYFHLYEQARESFLSHHGQPYDELVRQGYHLAVVESHQRFVKPVEYGAAVSISLWCDLLKRSSVRIWYRWENSDSNLLHEGWTRHAFVQNRDGSFAVAAFPPPLRQAFEQVADRQDKH